MPLHRTLLPLLCVAALAPAQSSIVLPEGYGRISSDFYTDRFWGVGNSGVRVQFIFDRAMFGRAGVVGEVLIDRLRWRAANWETATGGTYRDVNIVLAYAKYPYDSYSLSSTFSANYDGTPTTAYLGDVVVQTPSGTAPNDWYVDIALTTPFTFDASGSKDLILEVLIPSGRWSGGSSPPRTEWIDTNYMLMATRCKRIISSTPSSTSGTISGSTCPVELGLSRRPNQAFVQPFGRACHGPQWVYEPFTYGQFDFGGSAAAVRTIRVAPTTLYGGGFEVTTSTGGAWFTPTSAGTALGDEAKVLQMLPFAFPFDGATYTDAEIVANGYVSFGTLYTAARSRPETKYLRSPYPPVFSPFWTDLDLLPTGAGLLHYDVDPSGHAVYMTWAGARDWDQPSTSYDFQLALFADGSFEFRYGDMSVNSYHALVGWSSPAGAPFVLPTDLSEALPIWTGGGSAPLALTSSTPNVATQTTLTLQLSGIPGGSTSGAYVLGFQRYPTPVPLDLVGGVGCRLHVVSDIAIAPATWALGSGTHQLGLPMPTAPFWIGQTVHVQALSAAPGANPLQAVLSDGVAITFGNS